MRVPPEKPLPLISMNVRSLEEPNVGLKEPILWPHTRLAPRSSRITETKNREQDLILCWSGTQLVNRQAATHALPAGLPIVSKPIAEHGKKQLTESLKMAAIADLLFQTVELAAACVGLSHDPLITGNDRGRQIVGPGRSRAEADLELQSKIGQCHGPGDIQSSRSRT